jgi:hypothetical protein
MKRKIFFTIATILALFCTVKLYQSIKYNKILIKAFAKSDVSIQAPVICHNATTSNIWLISYAEGETYIANQNGLLASSINKCIDSIRIFHKKHIDPAYYAKHQSILSQKRGGGYWLWKPYLIFKTLNEIPENDILLYMDAGGVIIKPIDSLIPQLINHDIILFDMNIPNKQYTKKLLFQMMNMDNEISWNANQIQANILLIKNTKFARDFISEWLYWSEKSNAIMDSDRKDEYHEFIDHRHDQSIISLLSLNYRNKLKILPDNMLAEYFWVHRRLDFRKSSLVFPTVKLKIVKDVMDLQKD